MMRRADADGLPSLKTIGLSPDMRSSRLHGRSLCRWSEVGADEFEPRCLSSLLMRSESEVAVGNFSWAHHWFTTGTPFAYHQINASKEVSVE